MANGPLAKRQEKRVVNKTGQLAGMGVLATDKDNEGNRVTIQPTVLSRPNALQAKAFDQGNVGNQMPRAVLADMAIQQNQAISNQTTSGVSAAARGMSPPPKKKKKQGLQDLGGGAFQ